MYVEQTHVEYDYYYVQYLFKIIKDNIVMKSQECDSNTSLPSMCSTFYIMDVHLNFVKHVIVNNM